ncbi:uncharacterized protein LOC111615331 [Centruroides sculpturatus]|uniref:uncharacterized protein LOC111615331 n=1 Tax=Centruroides sculpturatus TaxID=218467 RepID=UPI000C6D8D2A|nr:uncharacterized protein LOC111615331 [Centruroides sculpturatus]
MADFHKQTERIRKFLSEVEVASDAEDDSDDKEDFVEEDEHFSDSYSYESETDVLPQKPQRKQSKKEGWLGKDQKTWWESKVPSSLVRARSHNVFRGRQGRKGPALKAQSPTDFWCLFITPEILDLLVDKTNEFISDRRPNFDVTSRARDTDIVEMKAFLGLLLLAGIYHSNRMNLDDLWNVDGTGVEVFRLTMSLQCFRFLLCCIRFDSKVTRLEKRKVDKLAPIRDLFEMFVENCVKNYSPSKFVTIDEMLVAFRGKCPFRQYIPSKPSKYGIKIQAMADAKTYYVCKIEIYAGKQPDGPFKVDNSANGVVSRLISEISGSGRNVTFDNDSFPLVKMLMEVHKLSSVGTLRKNKREIPKEFLDMKNRCNYDSMFGFTGGITLVSYIPQTKKKKNVVVLSSMHYDNKIDPNSGDKKNQKLLPFTMQLKEVLIWSTRWQPCMTLQEIAVVGP